MFLELKNCTIGYKKPLIKDINANLNLGEVSLIIGNNGVGKTTLIKSILHQINTLNGNVFIDSKNIKASNVKDIAKAVAVVFSKADIPANYTVTDLISFGKYIHLPYYFELNEKDKADVQKIIKTLGLEKYRDLKLTQLSDGNLQKAFIGRALVQNTPCIILDEPTTHLDEDNKIMILQIIRNLAKKQNKAILFSSHDWRLAKEFSDKIWYIKSEKLLSGITEEILLNQHELIEPQLFKFNQNFIAPKIIAPKMEAEMLFSFLQKNFNQDLSQFTFRYQNQNWINEYRNIQSKHNNLEDILKYIHNSI